MQPKRDWTFAAYRDYVLGKQTLTQLAVQTGKSLPTLRKHFDALVFMPRMLAPDIHPISLVCDTTFFGRKFGVMVFRARQKTLWWRFVASESAEEMHAGLQELMQAGWRFHGITVDGRKSALTLLRMHYPDIAVQLCQFHVMQTIRRTLGRKPKTPLGQELLGLINRLTRLSQDAFAEQFLTLTLRKYRNQIGLRQERTSKKAVRTIEQALPYLFTYQKYPERHIPNTTNSCEGSFGQWKIKIKLHRGTTVQRQQKMISCILQQTT